MIELKRKLKYLDKEQTDEDKQSKIVFNVKK